MQSKAIAAEAHREFSALAKNHNRSTPNGLETGAWFVQKNGEISDIFF